MSDQVGAGNSKYRRALLLLNPGSRQGASADRDAGLSDGIGRLEAAGLALEKIISRSAAESAQIIRARRDSTDLVILGGGDGTVSSCAEVLLDCSLPFAILPLGTANDLARSVGVNDLPQAFDAILSGQSVPIDLGVVNGHYFFNVANLGLGVRVTHELTPEVKQRWGVLGYLKALISAFVRHRHFLVEIRVGDQCHSVRSIQVAVGNGRFYGGGNAVAREAAIDDGMLHLYSLRPQTFLELLSLAPLLRGGHHDLVERVFTAEGRRLAIETNPPGMEVHADGEPVTRTPVTFSVKTAALTVMVPGDSPLIS